MRFEHALHPGRGVRLAYGLNVHPAEDLEGVLEGLRTVTLPLARLLREEHGLAGAPGIGPWWSAALGRELAASLSPGTLVPAPGGALDRLARFLEEHALEPCTWNAFPAGGFHRPGLKARVFEPAWSAPERLAFTRDVARAAAALARGPTAAALARGPTAAARAPAEASHLSLSTHAGGFGGADAAERAARAAGLADAARLLRRLHEESGVRVVLGVEPEPRSHANDTRALARLFGEVHAALAASGDQAAGPYLGTCLDACHAAVELEDEAEALARATDGVPLAKLQFSSALALRAPADDAARAALLALDEPVFLHQVTALPAQAGAPPARALDLSEARRAWDAGAPGWRDAREWRCHFHVPVHRERAPEGAGAALPEALGTTLASAERLLALALAAPERWGTPELHVEIETYTWSLFARPADEPLAAALAREVAHVAHLLERLGWRAVG